MATRSVVTRSNRPISRARTAAEEIFVRRKVYAGGCECASAAFGSLIAKTSYCSSDRAAIRWPTFWRPTCLQTRYSAPSIREGSIETPLTVLAQLQQKGLLRHIGLSNVTSAQIAEARQIAPIVCVQNHYNLAHRTDDALVADLAGESIAYVPFFPLGRVHSTPVGYLV